MTKLGPFLIGIAAFIWATDSLLRYPTVNSVDPTVLVFIEHCLAVAVLAPIIFLKYRKQAFSLSLSEWLAAGFSGICGSALAMVLFTASFQYVKPSVSILLLKLQPVLVVPFAFLVLGERPGKKFFTWGILALAAGIIICFPDFNFRFLSAGVDLHSRGIQYALSASIIWAASTVSGKLLLQRTPLLVAAFWRFTFGLITLSFLLVLAGDRLPWTEVPSTKTILSLLYLGLIPGLFGMVVYYAGLARTQATTAKFVELLYPLGAIALNTVFLHASLNPIQTGAGAVLLFAVTLMSIQ